MTKNEFLKTLDRIPLANPDITIGKCVVIDEKQNLTAILRLGVRGFVFDQASNEIHFLLDLEHVKQVFWPSDVTLLKDIPAAEHGFHNPIIHDLDEDADASNEV